MTRPFVLLDRDGTLLEDRGYAFRAEDYAPLAGAHAAVAALRAVGFGVVVVTNQSGIGRGLFSAEDYARFEALLLRDFAAHGAALDAVYHCPHAPDVGCACRKPNPGMALQAARDHDIDLAASWVIGDQPSDAELARRVGARALLVRTGQGAHAARVEGVRSARDLGEAAALVIAARDGALS